MGDKTVVKKDKQLMRKLLSPIFAIGRYFKGSWIELKQVRWPNRKSTWGLTAAVLFFTGLFLALIVSLDALFNWLFNLIIK
jgi:preprotein translocase SecE subunit